MSEQTIETLCAMNPESLGVDTPPDFEFRYVDISAVKKGQIDWSATQLLKLANAPSRARRLLRTGDVLLCTVRPGLQAHARIMKDADAPLVGSTGFAVLRPNEPSDSGFVFHQLFDEQVAAQLRALETGSNYPAVNERDIRQVRIFMPDRNERALLAAVLDTLDEAIAKTEAVIAKLKQVRAGLLHDLLTRGLDEHGQLRPSPAEAPYLYQDSPLGKIPSKWEIARFRDVSTIQTGDKDTQDKSDDGLYPFYVRSDVVERINSFSFDGEAILTAGDGVGVGKVVHYANGKFDYHQRVYCIHSFADWTYCRFMYYYFKNNFGQRVAKMSAKNSVDSVRMDMISEMLAPCPPLSEQVEIASILRNCEIQIESLCVELSKLYHLKSALMSDLLTGRVRVPADLDFD